MYVLDVLKNKIVKFQKEKYSKLEDQLKLLTKQWNDQWNQLNEKIFLQHSQVCL